MFVQFYKFANSRRDGCLIELTRFSDANISGSNRTSRTNQAAKQKYI